MEHGMRGMIIYISILVSLVLVGCGGGSGASLGSTQTPTVGKVTESSLLGEYHSLSLRYSTDYMPSLASTSSLTSPTGILPGEAYYTNQIYSTDAFSNVFPLFSADPINLSSYSFGVLTTGVGAMSLRTTVGSLPVDIPFSSGSDGEMAVMGLSRANITSPVLSVHLKALPSGSQLEINDFAGNKGFASVSMRGYAVIADMSFSNGVSTGKGLSSTASGVLTSLANTNTTSYSLNALKNKLSYLGSEWFVNQDGSIALSPEGVGNTGDRMSFLMSPYEGSSLSGGYNVWVWTIYSPNSASTKASQAPTMVLPVAGILKQGTIKFTGSSAELRGVVDTDVNVAFSRVPGTNAMWYFPQYESINVNARSIRFFISKDQNYLVGVDYRNDKTSTVSLFVGTRRQE
jgi:hypothetical protein